MLLPKPEGSVRILVLGNSFAYGAGNSYEQSWPTLVERQLQRDGHPVEIVKAGVPGYDTRTEALFLERIFAEYQPDLVLLTFLPNDLFTNVPVDGQVTDPGERLRSRGVTARTRPCTAWSCSSACSWRTTGCMPGSTC